MPTAPKHNKERLVENEPEPQEIRNVRRSEGDFGTTSSTNGNITKSYSQNDSNGVSHHNQPHGSTNACLCGHLNETFVTEDNCNHVSSESRNHVSIETHNEIAQGSSRSFYTVLRDKIVWLFLFLVGPVPDRQRWNSLSDSIMNLLAVTVGLGNMWRFPYYCYKHEGVNFLIAYGVILLVIGVPIHVVDISVGQYLSLGPTNAFASMAPLFSGLGWAMVMSSMLVSIYYTFVLSWTITYIYHSFRADFPFASNGTTGALLNASTNNYQIAKEFFSNDVLHLNKGNTYEIRYEVVLSLGLAWLIVMWSLVRGIRSSSKVIYITNTFPYAVLILLLAYSYLTYSQEVWNESFRIYLSPAKINATTLLTFELWADAASQALFSSGHMFGGCATLASYNDLQQNTLWTAVIIVLWDTITSLLCGSVTFVSLSKLASDMNGNVQALFDNNHTLGRMGVEVVFIAYPAFLADVRSPIWFVLFFLMILALGIDSVIGQVETVTTALFDNFSQLRNRYFPVVCVVICALFLLGLPMCTNAGFYIVECMHAYTSKLSIPLLGITHAILICYVFGFGNFMKILREELKVTVPKIIEWYLKPSLMFMSPMIFAALVVRAAINTKVTALQNDPLPEMYTAFGWILSIAPFLLVPTFAIYKCIKMRNWDWRTLLKPTEDFLPAHLRETSNRPEMYVLAEY